MIWTLRPHFVSACLQVRVHLVDLGSRELAQAFIVAVTGTPPAYNRSFEVGWEHGGGMGLVGWAVLGWC
jgi:hypothetical protein